MDKIKSSAVYVECGIVGEQPKNPSYLFLPVLKASSIPIVWEPPILGDYSISFTSKHSVRNFKSGIISSWNEKKFWHLCQNVSAVGKSTAEVIKNELPDFLFQNNKTIIYPKNGSGLLALLFELKKTLNPKSTLYIFTSLIGKTEKIVSESEADIHFNHKVVPVYTLINVDENLIQSFLKTLFLKAQSENTQFVFLARSGQILNSIIMLLMNFFNVTNPVNLPSFILFSPWEKSAQNVLLELKLIDRVIS